MKAKWIVAIACLAGSALTAAPDKIVPFSLPGPMPFAVSFLMSSTSTVAAHEKIPGGDSIRAHIDVESDPPPLIQIRDSKGEVLWFHDFGELDNDTPEGCTVTVSYQSKSRLLLVEYQGFKSSSYQTLLFVEPDKHPAIREYSTADRDILPLLKRQKDFPPGYAYWITPLDLSARGVRFACLAVQKPEARSVHEFDSGEPEYIVTATVNALRRIVPIAVESR